ncbi:MAG: response regulator [Anaerolineales bacterium]|nr:response regulator [Anaerolineales bacterium]MCX7756187.1 response regulator [Anaerolineales bacterium]MDW8276911.1 response regulator [Anaerolineales bacterium]
MMQGRVLVVDDLPDVRSTASGLLRDAGYFTRVAASFQEALDVLETERFHIAVLDVRLDESDEDNREGMALLREINRLYPAIAVILLTGYADAETVREALQPIHGRQPAFSVVFKNEMTGLTDTVRAAFQNALHLNLDLVIEDPHESIVELAGRIRFLVESAPSLEETVMQIREVFGKLFFECEQIRLGRIQQGFSGAAVFHITPVYRERGEGQSVVVKVGNRQEIGAEIVNYERYVRGIVGGHRIPEALRTAETRDMAGILYSFIGLGGQTENFSTYYHAAWLDGILPVLDNLYRETLFPLKDRTGRMRQACDLRAFYLKHLHLNEAKLQSIVTGLEREQTMFQTLPDGTWLFGAERLPDPLRYAVEGDFRADVFFATIHGDLNGQNILLDAHHDTWLIDFLTTTDDGHVLQDYAALETHLRFRLAPEAGCNLETLLRWAQGCFDGNLQRVPLSAAIYEHAGLLKAHQVMLHIRVRAAQTTGYTDRAYLIALFFNTLRAATYREASAFTRNHALYCAAKIAARLCASGD